MTQLRSLLTDNDETRAAVAGDFAALVERKVDQQGGISGTLLKGTLSAAKKADSDIVRKAINRVLPEIADELDPHWTAFQQPGAGSSFGTYLEQHSDEVIDSVLKVADRNVEKVNAAPVKKLYSTVRGKSEKLITDSLYDAGEIIHKHAS